MTFVKRIISTVVILSLFTAICIPAYADTSEYSDIVGNSEAEQEETKKDNNNENEELDILNKQLNTIYKEVGEELKINSMYVKLLHMIAGGKAVYSEEVPNVYVDTTVDHLDLPFYIKGSNQEYNLIAPWANCPDEDTVRPCANYLPDAAYNVTATIVSIMNSRYKAERGYLQDYFDALSNDVKTNILFCEALLCYIGDTDAANSFYNIYERFLYEKSGNENVIEINTNGEYKFKDKYLEILNNNGITDEWSIEVLCKVLRFDSKLAASSSFNEVSTSYVIPYKVDYTSRENLMLAAMSVVGKVRYVWGGGHGTTGAIAGINPMWESFNNSYIDAENNNEEVYNCIRPNNGWCPIHGTVNGGNGCLFSCNTIYSIDEYLEERKDIIDVESFDTEAFKELMSVVNMENGLNSHRLDGLDCSGYMSWLFSQITDKYNFDSGATAFISQYGMRSITPSVDKILPGDVFSWGDHIIMLIGEYSTGSNVYLHIEATPDTVKFGVSYTGNAGYLTINRARELADEANILFGDIDLEKEGSAIYNLDNIGGEYKEFGRLRQSYIDEYTVMPDFHKRFVNMTAQEIIQHTVDEIGAKYLSGAYRYDGKSFSLKNVDMTQIVVKAPEIDVEDIVLTDELTGVDNSVKA